MKKTVILVIAFLILLIWGFYTLDAYLCSHLYYWRWPFTSCTWWQWKGVNILWQWLNRWKTIWWLLTAAIPVVYLLLAKRVHSKMFGSLVFVGLALSTLGGLLINKSIFPMWFVILIFNLAVIATLIVWFSLWMYTLWDKLASLVKRNISTSVYDAFLKFTIGLVAFCTAMVLLLQIQMFYGVVIWAIVIWLTYLMIVSRAKTAVLMYEFDGFLQKMVDIFTTNMFIKVLFVLVAVVFFHYVFTWTNYSFIPYPTAWDANHAYIFFPRAWALNHWIYWWDAQVAWINPNLWFGYLTFWFTFVNAIPGTSWLFGIWPDALTIIMNFISWPLVFVAIAFLLREILHCFVDSKINEKYSLWYMFVYLIWLFLTLLWLTSGMWAFLVFIDNKPDLAVLFFSMIALYAGIKFLLTVQHGASKQEKNQHAVLSWLFFAAAILAKPTWLFDAVHFAMLFLLQRNWLSFAIWGYLAVVWVLWLTKLLLVEWLVSSIQSFYLIGLGWILMLIGLIPMIKNKGATKTYLRPFLLWCFTVIVALLIYKWPLNAIQQLKNTGWVDIKQFIRTVFLAKAENNQGDNTRVLLVSNVDISTLQAADMPAESPEVCTAESIGDLYWNLKKLDASDWATEDLWRYIWFWQKKFNSLWIWWLIPKWCYAINQDAKILCGKENDVKNMKVDQLVSLLTSSASIIHESRNDRLEKWIELLTDQDTFDEPRIRSDIANYISANTLVKNESGIYIPYKLLIPFNVTFNWSLQNLSSYYTDIGIIWILLLFLVILSIPYALIKRKKHILRVSVITLWARLIWGVVWSAIVWYSLWIIIRTIIATLLFIRDLMDEYSDRSYINSLLVYFVIWMLFLWGIIQLVLNLVRISSQWMWWPFAWYKSNVWEEYIITEQLVPESSLKVGYSAKDVFDMQFSTYNPVLSVLNNRGEDEWVTIAWTYMQYYIDDQSNVVNDWFLWTFWEIASDNDVCKTYLRLKDKKKKYIVVDPNIASVIMWDWNKSLFDRFYAVVDGSGKLQQHGTLSMLQALSQKWYLKLQYTNNLITKYAFVIPDEQLAGLLAVDGSEELLLERARMTAARFFPNGDRYGNVALQLFVQRLSTMEALQDLADAFGKEIRFDMLSELARIVSTTVPPERYKEVQGKLKELTQWERLVLQQYLSIKKAQQSNQQQFRQAVIGILQQSINSPSQVISLEIK